MHDLPSPLVTRARAVADSDLFASGVAMLVLANTLAAGLETVDAVSAAGSEALFAFFWVSQALFLTEIAIRVAAEGPPGALATWRAFLADRWNRFDTVLVLLTLVPLVGSFAPIARMFRTLRVLRVVSTFGSIRVGVESAGLAAALPAALLTAVAWYGFAVAGHQLFGHVDEAHWGGIFASFRSVFFLGVLSEVGAIAGPVTDRSPLALGYFLAFYGAAAAIVLQAVAATVRGALGPDARGEP